MILLFKFNIGFCIVSPILALQNNSDESQQLQAAIEMYQLLVMDAFIPLLHLELNFDLTNHAFRTLTCMMESLPRSSAVVVESTSALQEKLKVIQCMDVAEQSLMAMEILSRRHAKSILPARGVSACLTYLDFFGINAQRAPSENVCYDAVQLQWQDDCGSWHAYSVIDSRMVDVAHQSCEDEISLSTSTTTGRIYTLDLHAMQQINEETSTTRSVQRKMNNSSGSSGLGGDGSVDGIKQSDSRIEFLQKETQLATQFIRSLFSLLYEVYSSSAGLAVRHKCLRDLLRMLYYASSELLRDVLKNQCVASHLAGMLSSQDLKIVVGATQMAHILMQKLPDVFGVHFRREGVMHQVQRLVAEPAESPLSAATTPAAIPTPFQVHTNSVTNTTLFSRLSSLFFIIIISSSSFYVLLL